MTNKKLGNNFELFFCQKLFSNGFWTHNFAQKQSGQPADVIAVRNKVAYLIDCKVCSRKGFNLNRIEENQNLSMKLWFQSGNGVGFFAFLIDEKIYLIEHPWLLGYSKVKNFITNEHIKEVGTPFEKWVNLCE